MPAMSEIKLDHELVTQIENHPDDLLSEHFKATQRKALRKIDLFLLPTLCVLLMVAFLDRTAIGNSRIQGMDSDLHMKGNEYNISLFVFFIPYTLLDIPSNILMKNLRPSLYLPGLMFAWGAYSVLAGSPLLHPTCLTLCYCPLTSFLFLRNRHHR